MKPRGAGLALAFALAGCSAPAAVSGGGNPSPSVVSSSPLPEGWSVRTDSAQGFSLAVPDAWEAAFRDSPSLDADLKAINGRSPQLGAYFRQSFAGTEELRLVAADPRSLASGYVTNLNVMSSDLGSSSTAPSLDELLAAKSDRLSQDRSVVKPVRRAHDHLAGQAAARIDYLLSTPAAAATVRTFLVVLDRQGERFLFELTIGATPDLASSIFEPVAGHFMLFPPGQPPGAPSPSPTAS